MDRTVAFESRLPNNKMQQARHGQNGASLLILVFDGQRRESRLDLTVMSGARRTQWRSA